ncbi:MAG: hypothetical protein JSW10_03485 [Pseudomonadota bacterium]|nr:MAG: hypothetical protein JSW10_03485 [Pseudomonadota bacterium]
MNRFVLASLIPPLAVCRYGCAGCCAAPIAVFWITGIVSLVYGYFGGPSGVDQVSWGTMGLGVVLWAIAAVWANMTIRTVADDLGDPKCENRASTICRIVPPHLDDSDPMDELKKYQ